MKSKFFVFLALLIILSMVLAACGGADEEPTPAPAPVEQPTPAPAEQPTEAAAPVEQPTEAAAAPVAAGEQSGHLDVVFERLADYTEARQQMRQKVGLALFYPLLLTGVAILVVAGLLTYCLLYTSRCV